MEKHTRSIVKAISWRVIATLTTTISVYIFSGNLQLTASVAALDTVAKLFFYYGHERAWNKVLWGRNPTKLLKPAGNPQKA